MFKYVLNHSSGGINIKAVCLNMVLISCCGKIHNAEQQRNATVRMFLKEAILIAKEGRLAS